jgi:hypothetical protein
MLKFRARRNRRVREPAASPGGLIGARFRHRSTILLKRILDAILDGVCRIRHLSSDRRYASDHRGDPRLLGNMGGQSG